MYFIKFPRLTFSKKLVRPSIREGGVSARLLPFPALLEVRMRLEKPQELIKCLINCYSIYGSANYQIFAMIGVIYAKLYHNQI